MATVSSWKERLSAITAGYALDDVWNLDETGCFYRALPDKSLSEKAKRCKGGKKSKEQLTVALIASATGEKRKPIVIGKYGKPRCLKSINRDDLTCEYYNQQKAWMTSHLLHTILSKLNRFFKAKNRSVLLFLDSAGCHPYDLKGRYSNIKLFFFPVNCISELQPLDLGIIQNFKVHYRKLLLRHVVAMASDELTNASEIGNSLNVLQAMNWMGSAWNKVDVTTISKCFAAAGFSKHTSEAPGDENDDPFADLDEDFQSLIDQVAPGISWQLYLESDEELPICFNAEVNEQQLLETLNTSRQDTIIVEGDSDDNGDSSDEENKSYPTSSLKSYREVLESIRNIELFFIQHGKFSLANDFFLLADKVSENSVNERSHQSMLERYFAAK